MFAGFCTVPQELSPQVHMTVLFQNQTIYRGSPAKYVRHKAPHPTPPTADIRKIGAYHTQIQCTSTGAASM